VLQRDEAAPTPDQLKRVFKSFSNLTDADAVRVAVGAHGILMKHLGQDEARALQRAFRGEGIVVAVVAENDLRGLPQAIALHRLDLWPQALTVYDHVGQPTTIPWPDVTVVAAAAAQRVELSKTQTEFIRRQLNIPSDTRLRKAGDSHSNIGRDSQLVLELIVGDAATRYEIDATQFTFKYVIDRPGLAAEEKFIWLVREICREATRALVNSGARSLVGGAQTVPSYANRQALTDEIVWLLWRRAQRQRA
jgi:hypothetical protein